MRRQQQARAFAVVGAALVGGRSGHGARQPRSDALLEVVSDQSVQLYVSGSGTHGAYSRTLLARAGEESFPWRVVEELRARLVELGFELPGDAAPSAPAPPSLTAARSRPENGSEAMVTDVAAQSDDVGDQITLWGGAGLGGILAAGGLGPAFAGVLGLGVQTGPSVSLCVAASLPLSNNGTTAREGEVDVSVKTIHVEAEYASQLGRGWALGAGVGGGSWRSGWRPKLKHRSSVEIVR